MGEGEHSPGPEDQRFVIRPNRSLSWRGAKRYFGLQALASAAVALPLAWLGAWLILPFTAVALVAVAVSFYLVLLRTNRIEVVWLTENQVAVERGRRGPEERTEFPRSWVQVVLEPAEKRLGTNHLFLRAYGRQTEIGAFLTNEERERLARDLARAIRSGPTGGGPR
ncbi:hypothetical protein AN478_02125 [Thiohalorhabdus denitrificans]|uniref:Uncharacterized membrane protein n=1 Tax=Thiohalorhabdus denitrificans TaxID=381306 RepID=A0A0P9C839_9GAMM|nr:DUF2244 domain-containing protein [Thiohalorhabdus denitrificans]KPV41396.1 hypothetical protein AN478_02125 [Thiohalorhabdus denitrificans]SCY25884.1 Uncharacterized membrane protein [Thiohalorhabdus denitrificans]